MAIVHSSQPRITPRDAPSDLGGTRGQQLRADNPQDQQGERTDRENKSSESPLHKNQHI